MPRSLARPAPALLSCAGPHSYICPHLSPPPLERVRESNIVAAKAVADAVRTSLGPRGMDKMISSGSGEVVITNDGATILKMMQVSHPTAKMLVNLSASQDVEAGDGTTTVTVIAGSLLNAAEQMLKKGIHPTVISEAFLLAAKKSEEILKEMSVPVDLADRESLIKAASTSLNSKVISNNASLLAPLAVDALLSILPPNATNVDLKDIAVVKKLGGTIDDTELVKGLVFTQKVSHAGGGPTKVVNAKIALIQFCISAPKTDIEQNIVVSDYSQMDRILKVEPRCAWTCACACTHGHGHAHVRMCMCMSSRSSGLLADGPDPRGGD